MPYYLVIDDDRSGPPDFAVVLAESVAQARAKFTAISHWYTPGIVAEVKWSKDPVEELADLSAR